MTTMQYADHSRDAGKMAAPDVQARPFHDLDPNWLYSVIRYARKAGFDPDVTEGLREMDEDEVFLVPNLYAAPQPAEQQPVPDVSALVEALELMLRVHDLSGSPEGDVTRLARTALAAHLKGG